MKDTFSKYIHIHTAFLLKILLVVFFVQIQVVAFAQTQKKIDRWFSNAKMYYSAGNISSAKDICNSILKSNPEFINAHLLLADIYNETDSTLQEIRHLNDIFEISDKPLVLYRLGEANYALGNYKQALKYFREYSLKTEVSEARSKEIDRKINNCEFAIWAIENPVKFEPVRLSDGVNSTNDEYWPSLSIDQKTLVFTRLNKEKGKRPQEDFYISELDSLGWGKAAPIVEINTGNNEGAQTISADGKFLFFTACSRRDGKGSCDIYISEFKDGEWKTPINAGSGINTPAWEAQPSFSSDNRFLYFSSDRRGGKGKKDIWSAEFLGFSDDGIPKWNTPVNLGEKVNSAGDEISPFIHPNNKSFYFVSNFHTGMGGYDIFETERLSDSAFSEIKNLGYPINNINNEQGLVINATGNMAYFSSKRDKNSGMDLFRFELDEKLRPDPVTYIKLKVIDAKSNMAVQSEVNLYSITEKINERTVETDLNGTALLCLPLQESYVFNVSKEGYLFYSESFDLNDSKTMYDPIILNIKLDKVELGAEMNLYNIYFETDSFNILATSEPELQKLVLFLSENKTINIEIQGHTDNSGGADKNLILSGKRAKSVLEYLVKMGISSSRLRAKGYGEKKPVSSNDTKDARKLNRRTTIKILSNFKN